MMSAPALQTDAEQDCRCHCGSLLARLIAEGVELKCRRCKRTVLIGWSQIDKPRPEAQSPESCRRATARPGRTRWLEPERGS